VVEYLPSKHEALSLNTRTGNKTKQRKLQKAPLDISSEVELLNYKVVRFLAF
jgi:hypothetical protein